MIGFPCGGTREKVPGAYNAWSSQHQHAVGLNERPSSVRHAAL